MVMYLILDMGSDLIPYLIIPFCVTLTRCCLCGLLQRCEGTGERPEGREAKEDRELTVELRKLVKKQMQVREDFKYYFADFVRKRGGGGTPQIRKSLFAEKKIRKGGEGGTPQIRNSFFAGKKIRKGGGVPPLRTKSAK